MLLKNNGKFWGIMSGGLWALYSIVLFYILDVYKGSIGNINSLAGILYIVYAVLIIAIIDLTITVFVEILFLYRIGKLMQFKTIMFSSKSFKIIPAAFLAGPLGLIPYSIASYYSVSISGSISAIYPIIGMFAASIMLRNNKITLPKITGAFFAVLGTICLYGISDGVPVIAYILSFVAALGWGLEAIFGYKLMDEGIDDTIVITLRHIYSILIYVFICVMIILISSDPSYIFGVIKNITTTSAFGGLSEYVWILFILASMFGAFSYITWYKSMKLCGVSPAMVLNISYGLWINIFIMLLDKTINLWMLVGSVFIFVGSTIIILYNDNK